jgi:hypothetical protein
MKMRITFLSRHYRPRGFLCDHGRVLADRDPVPVTVELCCGHREAQRLGRTYGSGATAQMKKNRNLL